jgi:hypothetical protein
MGNNRRDSSEASDERGRSALVRIARCAVDETALGPIHSDLWTRLPHDAEANHLAPLLDSLIRTSGQPVPDAAAATLRALMLRHRAWHRARTNAVHEVLSTLERRAIDALVLKGAALAWTIYQAPTLRPMADVDLLVPRPAAPLAQQALLRLGFRADRTARHFGRNMHHLPVAARVDGGVTINVEIHVDALSRDSLSSIDARNLTEPPRSFMLDGARRLMLGHVDMLRHLTHHLVEPSPDGCVRLIAIVDLLRYACTFHDRIDWPRVERDFPFVVNALGCLHHVVQLPAVLGRFVPPSADSLPRRIGETMRPLRSILERGGPPRDIVRELFEPPDWWMHAYYNVPPGRSLTRTQLFDHPWRVAQWLRLRVAGF